jgi:hypothetical protein
VESSVSGGDGQRSRVGAGKGGSSVSGGDGQISRSAPEKEGDLPENGEKFWGENVECGGWVCLSISLSQMILIF